MSDQCPARYRIINAAGFRGEMFCLRDEGHEGPHTDRHGNWPDDAYALELRDLARRARLELGVVSDMRINLLCQEIDAALAKNPNELPEGATGNAGSIPARSPRFGKEKQVRLLPVDPDGSGGRDSRERPALPNAKCARCGFIRSEHDPDKAWCPVPMSMGGESYIDHYDTDHTFTDTPVTEHIQEKP